MSSDIRRVFSNLLDNMEILYCGNGVSIESVVLNKDITSYIDNKSHVIIVSYNYYQTATNNYWRVGPLQALYYWKKTTDSEGYTAYYTANYVYSFYRSPSTSEGTGSESVRYYPSSLTFTTNYDFTGSMLVAAIPVTI